MKSLRMVKFRKDRIRLWLFFVVFFVAAMLCKKAFADPSIYESLDSGRQTVSSAGTRVQLSSTDTPVKRVVVEAFRINPGIVVVGGQNVVASQSTRQGISLASGDTVTLYVNNLTDIYVDAATSGDGVSFIWYR